MAGDVMTIRSYDQLIEQACGMPRQVVAVAAAEEESVLEALSEARSIGLADAVLVGDERRISGLASEMGISLDGWELVPAADSRAAAAKAVELVRTGRASVLMKGKVGSADFLRACLDKETGLRPTRLLSHVALFEAPRYHKLMAVTDGGLNIAPDLHQKAQILQNAIEAMQGLGVERPKAAVLAAVELVNPDMPATLDAAALTLMSERGQVKGGVVDGPLAFDNAISSESAREKGIASPVAGDADILLVPNIETGNAVGKCLIYFGDSTMAGLVWGARVPIVLTSRAETARGRLVSLAWAAYQAGVTASRS